MKKRIFGAILTCQLLAPSVGLANADEITSKEESTDTSVKTKLTQNGGRDEREPNYNAEKIELRGSSDLEKSWGYAYIPKKMKISSANNRNPLKDEGSQQIKLTGQDTADGHKGDHDTAVPDFVSNPDGPQSAYNTCAIHLGTKNKSRQTGAWNLTAKVNLKDKLGDKAAGATFTSNNTQIRDNYDNHMTPLSDNELEIGLQTKGTDHKISLNNDFSEIFKGKEGIVHNGTYDVAMRQCSVNIPDIRRIQNDDFNCQITWNLAKVPGGESLEEAK